MTSQLITKYPCPHDIARETRRFISTFDVIVSNWDEFTYEKVSEYDWRFIDDEEWDDVKDELHAEVLEILGVE